MEGNHLSKEGCEVDGMHLKLYSGGHGEKEIQ